MTVRVKICGLTNAEDALHAAKSGADMLGFIFAPVSKRYITPETAQPIVEAVREAMGDQTPLCFGVFVADESIDPKIVSKACQISGVDGAQLVEMKDMDFLHAVTVPAYAVVRPETPEQAVDGAQRFRNTSLKSDFPTLLLDTYHPTLHGGTGETTPVEVAKALVEQTDRLMLAGGLNPDNVAEFIENVRPWAVDVASGTEATVGKKDPDKVQRFISTAKGVKL